MKEIEAINKRERIDLIKRNVQEIITEEKLDKLLKTKSKPVVYCGYEPNGPLHLGHFVTISKLIDLERAGFKVKILLADIHALLNRKGGEKGINREINAWKKTIKAIGINAEIVLGSDFQFNKDYQIDVMKLAQQSTIHRGLRSMQEIARDAEHATISQLWYPLMQVADIKYLGADAALGGMEQRKVHMIGKDMSQILQYDFIAIHTPLITSFKGPGEKMSKSIQGSGIAVTDTQDYIKKTIHEAYCPEKIVQNNPILQIAQFIIFPKFSVLEIARAPKYGGDISFKNYDELEKAYSAGKLHPMDLKNAAADALEMIIAPIREKFLEK